MALLHVKLRKVFWKGGDEVENWIGREKYTVEDLLEIVALLRDPEKGCAWDKVQTHESIRKNFIEETYEVADAIDKQDAHLLCEELGDVLLQIALHTQMERERGAFSWEDVCTGICKKLIARHPHIFGTVKVDNPEQALHNWEQIKRAEKHRESLSVDLDDVPEALPAAVRAQKLQKRAAAHGVGITDTEGAKQALLRSVERLQAMSEQETAEMMIGEVLFCTAGYARLLDVDAEQALERVNTAFMQAAKKLDKAADNTLLQEESC